MTSLPAALTLLDGAMAMDGGSIFLQACTPDAAGVVLHLDWSITSRDNGTPQFAVNNAPIPRGSEEENRWLELLQRASTVHDGEAPPMRDPEADRPNRLILSSDIADYFAAIEDGPGMALRALANRLVEVVTSLEYQSPPGRQEPPSPMELIRLYAADGMVKVAILEYRKLHPEVGMAKAKRAVLAMLNEA